MTHLDLDAIAARAAHLYERTATIDPNAHPDFGQLTDADVPALIAEIRHQRATIERLRGATPCNCLHNPTLTAQIGYPVRCPHCPPGTTVPPTHWAKHVQRHHPHAPSGPAGGAVSAPQPTHGPHSTPNADEATHSHTGGPTATPAAP